MKTINKFIAISLLFFSISVNAQSFVVSNDKENNLYLGVENPLIAIVEKMKCGSFILTTDNGEITEKENCRFIYNAKRIGTATITIIKVKGNDTVNIGKSVFNVKEIPKAIARIYGSNNNWYNHGLINKDVLINSNSIHARIENFEFSPQPLVLGYTVFIIKGIDSVYIKEVKGNRITEEIKNEFLNLKSNDRVYFIDIKERYAKHFNKELESLKFIIE